MGINKKPWHAANIATSSSGATAECFIRVACCMNKKELRKFFDVKMLTSN